MSVNVSAVQFLHPGFFDSVRNAIQDAGIGADRLVLEITESALMTDPKAAEACCRCARWASALPSTISAPAIRACRTCAASRCPRSRSTAASWPT
jgi:hypothetical protein